MAAAASPEVRALRVWCLFMGAIDVTVGWILILSPTAFLNGVIARMPAAISPLPGDPLSQRVLGIYAAGLAFGWLAGWKDPVQHASAIWASNALRVTGGIALALGTVGNAATPPGLRGVFAGELLFAAVTAVMMSRAGLTWLTPGKAAVW